MFGFWVLKCHKHKHKVNKNFGVALVTPICLKLTGNYEIIIKKLVFL